MYCESKEVSNVNKNNNTFTIEFFFSNYILFQVTRMNLNKNPLQVLSSSSIILVVTRMHPSIFFLVTTFHFLASR